MLKKFGYLVLVSMLFTGCSSVPMEGEQQNTAAKKFNPPSDGKSGLYFFRDSIFGAALKKDIWVDGRCIGETAPNMFFYDEVDGDKSHTISTESEFSANDLIIKVKNGMLYFVRQYIKVGVFVGGAGLELVDANKGKEIVKSLNLAKKGKCDKQKRKK